MIALPNRPVTRISLAIGLSMLVHAVVMFAPMVELPKSEVPLPPLTAKLEPLPKVAAKPAPARKPKPRPPAKEATPETIPRETAEETPPQGEAVAADEPAATATKPAPPLPKRARLTFIAYMGTDLQVGEARHVLEIGDDRNYTLEVSMNTTGLARVFKSFDATQKSSGTLTAEGLQPQRFSEEKKVSGAQQQLSADFDWAAHKLVFSHGGETALPERTQDILSFLYQLSQLPLDAGMVPMHISNGRKLQNYELEIGEEEYVQTRLGRLRALPLRKVHGPGEEGLDIWLGLEYRLLPIKIRQIDSTGKTAAEMVISEILVADE